MDAVLRPISLIAALIAGAAVYRYCPEAVIAETGRATAGVLAGACATLLGFLVSAGALIYAVSATALAQNLMRTGHLRNLLVDLFADIAVFLAALLLALGCLFLPQPSEGNEWMKIALSLTVAVSAFAMLLLIPVGRKMWLLLSNLSPHDKRLN